MGYTAPANGFRTFLILWASQSVSVFGTALSIFALNIWLVQAVYPLPEQQPQLAWALAAVGLAGAVPAMIFTPLAGALADRMDRKRLMLMADLASALLMAAVSYLMARGLLTVGLMLGFFALLTITGVIHGSAFDTSYAMLVSDEQLPRANGMMQTMWSLSAILSPAAAATLVALPSMARQGWIGGAPGRWLGGLENGAALATGIDAVTYLLAALVLTTLVIPSPRRADLGAQAKKASIWSDVRFGVVYIWRRKPLLWLLSTFAVVNLCLPLGVFIPLIVKNNLMADWTARGFTFETALAVINTALAAGGLAGGVLVSIWGGAKRRRVVVLLLAILVGGVMQMAMGLFPSLYLVAAAAFLFDVTAPIANAHSQAIWQSQVPREMQGRVFAVRRVIAQSLGPLSQVMAGVVAAALDPGLGLAILGGVIAVVGLVQLLNPVMLRVEDKEYLDRLAGQAQGPGQALAE